MIDSNKKKAIKFLFIFAAVVTVFSFLLDLHNTLNYPGTDLRNRVVGARLALQGIDPYFFKWSPNFSDRLYDPMDVPEAILSKLSVPPTVLALHSPIANLNYLQQKLIWLIFQWMTLIGILFIFYVRNKSVEKQRLVLAIGFLFANSLFWRFHANSGQIYIVYIGLLSISWYLLNCQFNQSEIASGFVAGITASLRPPYILFFFFFLVHRRSAFLLGGIVGIITTVLTSIALTGTFIWKQYVLAMLGMTGFVNLESVVAVAPSSTYPQAFVYPHIVEGIDFMVRNPLEKKLFSSSALRDVLVAFDLSHKKEILLISFVITFTILCWLGIKYTIRQKDLNLIFLMGTIICLTSEFFIPIGRYSYYDVQWLLPILIIVTTTSIQRLFASQYIWLLILGLALALGYLSWIDNLLFYCTYLIAGYVVLTAISLLRDQKQ